MATSKSIESGYSLSHVDLARYSAYTGYGGSRHHGVPAATASCYHRVAMKTTPESRATAQHYFY